MGAETEEVESEPAASSASREARLGYVSTLYLTGLLDCLINVAVIDWLVGWKGWMLRGPFLGLRRGKRTGARRWEFCRSLDFFKVIRRLRRRRRRERCNSAPTAAACLQPTEQSPLSPQQPSLPPCLPPSLPPSAMTRVTTTQLYIGSQNAKSAENDRTSERASERARCSTDEREEGEVLVLLRSISEERRRRPWDG